MQFYAMNLNISIISDPVSPKQRSINCTSSKLTFNLRASAFQEKSTELKQQLSQDGQFYYVSAWVLCFKTRVKSKIRSCHFLQFSRKQKFENRKFCRLKLKGNFKVVDMELMQVPNYYCRRG
ncbi:Hypothetical_protein [Hexamita inflata]|uniref:Hypothetical_protein n=1 Tax=Hexamita inflata TaxID=28002 RepID=A0AA86U6D6_9EUKA|nr:Hypothetical protein HINF_LOCUS27167 [Hexamita inflata]